MAVCTSFIVTVEALMCEAIQSLVRMAADEFEAAKAFNFNKEQ